MSQKLLEIQIAAEAGAPMQSLQSVLAIKSVGLEGDRYALKNGFYSKFGRDVEVTLIQSEVLAAIRSTDRYVPLPITFAATRRGLLTAGVNLNAMTWQRFRIGSVLFQGTQLCDPCSRLGELCEDPRLKANILYALTRQGGLNARILETGVINVGDEIVIVG